jgi:hypothetical protein
MSLRRNFTGPSRSREYLQRTKQKERGKDDIVRDASSGANTTIGDEVELTMAIEAVRTT